MSTDTLRVESISPAEPVPGGAPESMRFGSFAVTGTLPSADGQSIYTVVGAEGTAFAGRPGVTTTIAAPASADEIARVEVSLAKLRHLNHAALVPVLEAGSAGATVYWVHAVPDGAAGASDLPDAMPVTAVVALVARIGGALQIAHELGLSHGSISRRTLYRADGDKPVLAGLGITGRGFAADQRDLATVAVELLAGGPWIPPALAEDPAAARSRAMREFLSEYTERVAKVLIRATDPDAAEQFDSISEFAHSFSEAVRLSAEDLVFGAYEAISARSPDLARVIADKAATYDPDCESLTLLNLQLRGESPFAKLQSQPGLDDGLPALATAPRPVATPTHMPNGSGDLADIARSNLPEELTRDLPEEFLRAIAPQFTYTPSKSRVSPVFVLILGVVGIAVLLAAAGLGTVLISGR